MIWTQSRQLLPHSFVARSTFKFRTNLLAEVLHQREAAVDIRGLCAEP